jgi:hypothetical protein
VHAFLTQQHAQLSPQCLHVTPEKSVALVQPGKDHLQCLLHAVAQHLNGR